MHGVCEHYVYVESMIEFRREFWSSLQLSFLCVPGGGREISSYSFLELAEVHHFVEVCPLAYKASQDQCQSIRAVYVAYTHRIEGHRLCDLPYSLREMERIKILKEPGRVDDLPPFLPACSGECSPWRLLQVVGLSLSLCLSLSLSLSLSSLSLKRK